MKQKGPLNLTPNKDVFTESFTSAPPPPPIF